MGICILLQSISVVPSSGGELESALFCQTMALACPVFVRNVRPLWIKGSQKAVEKGWIRFHALAWSGLPPLRLQRPSEGVTQFDCVSHSWG